MYIPTEQKKEHKVEESDLIDMLVLKNRNENKVEKAKQYIDSI